MNYTILFVFIHFVLLLCLLRQDVLQLRHDYFEANARYKLSMLDSTSIKIGCSFFVIACISAKSYGQQDYLGSWVTQV